jgi:hypothetical protein
MHSKVKSFFVRLLPLPLHNLSMLQRPRPDVTLKVLWHTKEPRSHFFCHLDCISIFARLLAQIEAPQDTRYVDKKRTFRNMYTRTYTPSCAIREMISRHWIRCINVVCRRRRVVDIARGIESVGVGPQFWVAVNSPNVFRSCTSNDTLSRLTTNSELQRFLSV